MGKLEGPLTEQLAEVDAFGFTATGGGLVTTPRPYDAQIATIFSSGGQGGAHFISATTGLVTGGGLTAGAPIAAFCNDRSDRLLLIKRIEVNLVLPTSVTTAQLVGGDLVFVREGNGYGGTNVLSGLVTNSQKKRSSHSTTAAKLNMATTTNISPPSDVVREMGPFLGFRFWELATGATVPHGRGSMVWDARNPGSYPIVLESKGSSPNPVRSGIELQNAVAMTASGTQRWTVTIEWEFTNEQVWQRGQRGLF
jgi:hypothetical protein